MYAEIPHRINQSNQNPEERKSPKSDQTNHTHKKMASFATHFFAFIFLFFLGFRRILCVFSLYLKDPPHFKSKLWYFSEPRYRNFDLYTLIIALPIASFSNIFLFLSFSGHPTYRFAFFQQSLVVFLFWVLLILIILREIFGPVMVHESFVFIMASISFFVEYSVIGNGVTGLSGNVYDLLGGLTLVCAVSCLYLSVKPTAFFAEFSLCFGIIFKGTWVLQAGLNLYSDAFTLKGCPKILISPSVGENDVRCVLEEDRLRGIALMNLLFVVHAIVLLIACFGLFCLLTRNKSLRIGETSEALLTELESSEHMLTRPLPVFEME